MKAFVIRNDGTTEELEIGEFAELQRQCGGMISTDEGQWARLDGRIVESPSILAEPIEHLTMWCNEEGRMHEFPANVVATLVVAWPITEETVLVGDVVFTGPTDRAGNRTALADADVQKLEARAMRARQLLKR